MTIVYKMTDENDRTFGGTQWGEGVEYTASGKCELLGWHNKYHAYENRLIATFMNPMLHGHGGYRTPHLWEAEGEISERQGPLKCGCVPLKTLRRIPIPQMTTDERVKVAILCTRTVVGENHALWHEWAEDWLSGKREIDAERIEWAMRAAECAASTVVKQIEAERIAMKDVDESAKKVAILIVEQSAAFTAYDAWEALRRNGDSLDLYGILQQATGQE